MVKDKPLCFHCENHDLEKVLQDLYNIYEFDLIVSTQDINYFSYCFFNINTKKLFFSRDFLKKNKTKNIKYVLENINNMFDQWVESKQNQSISYFSVKNSQPIDLTMFEKLIFINFSSDKPSEDLEKKICCTVVVYEGICYICNKPIDQPQCLPTYVCINQESIVTSLIQTKKTFKIVTEDEPRIIEKIHNQTDSLWSRLLDFGLCFFRIFTLNDIIGVISFFEIFHISGFYLSSFFDREFRSIKEFMVFVESLFYKEDVVSLAKILKIKKKKNLKLQILDLIEWNYLYNHDFYIQKELDFFIIKSFLLQTKHFIPHEKSFFLKALFFDYDCENKIVGFQDLNPIEHNTVILYGFSYHKDDAPKKILSVRGFNLFVFFCHRKLHEFSDQITHNIRDVLESFQRTPLQHEEMNLIKTRFSPPEINCNNLKRVHFFLAMQFDHRVLNLYKNTLILYSKFFNLIWKKMIFEFIANIKKKEKYILVHDFIKILGNNQFYVLKKLEEFLSTKNILDRKKFEIKQGDFTVILAYDLCYKIDSQIFLLKINLQKNFVAEQELRSLIFYLTQKNHNCVGVCLYWTGKTWITETVYPTELYINMFRKNLIPE